jgi:hypothetical protein
MQCRYVRDCGPAPDRADPDNPDTQRPFWHD